MLIIEPSFEILDPIDGPALLAYLEQIGRVCYKSEARADAASARAFVERLIANGHESVLEHSKITVRLICDRGVSHELVRHRIASYSQESTRYCNYSAGRFGGQLTFIRPCFWQQEPERYAIWQQAMAQSEAAYQQLLALGAKPEEARSVLPTSLKTEIVVTMNLREWRHFFRLRTARAAHPQMRQLAIPLLHRFQELLPPVFADL